MPSDEHAERLIELAKTLDVVSAGLREIARRRQAAGGVPGADDAGAGDHLIQVGGAIVVAGVALKEEEAAGPG